MPCSVSVTPLLARMNSVIPVLLQLADLLADGGGGQRQRIRRAGGLPVRAAVSNARMALSLGKRARDGECMGRAIAKNWLAYP